MVHRDPKQQKLPFEKHTESDKSTVAPTAEGSAAGGPVQMVGAKNIMAGLRLGFRAIIIRFDILTTNLDDMGERLEKQQAWLKGVGSLYWGLRRSLQSS
ncbi:hypothetical protein NDU88_003886 [Pleurodeles waltl]|uniref:Uncharacterized protein n=1 Tax=Pleurodeles waltl TaxID=8319 RepID=A0AAV7PE41_PLEWA|nr:hypothetical protein NDU88_003886 [Pleurodeles waltl]